MFNNFLVTEGIPWKISRVFLKNRHGKKLSSRCQVSKENGCVYLNSTVRMAFSGLKVKMNTWSIRKIFKILNLWPPWLMGASAMSPTSSIISASAKVIKFQSPILTRKNISRSCSELIFFLNFHLTLVL